MSSAQILKMAQERDDLRNSNREISQLLSNLLARIHRDGGHYEAEHGTAKAVADADVIVANMYAMQKTLNDQKHKTKPAWYEALTEVAKRHDNERAVRDFYAWTMNWRTETPEEVYYSQYPEHSPEHFPEHFPPE